MFLLTCIAEKVFSKRKKLRQNKSVGSFSNAGHLMYSARNSSHSSQFDFNDFESSFSFMNFQLFFFAIELCNEIDLVFDLFPKVS